MSGKICPQCQTENIEVAWKCKSCGATLPDISSGNKKEQIVKTCNKCGYQNRDDAIKCTNCYIDLQWAKVNLGKFTGTDEDTKRIGEEERQRRGIEAKNYNEARKIEQFKWQWFDWLNIVVFFFIAEIFLIPDGESFFFRSIMRFGWGVFLACLYYLTLRRLWVRIFPSTSWHK